VAGLSEQIEALLQDGFNAADDLDVPVSTVVRKALRIARLRSDWTAALWLLMEIRGRSDPEAKNRAGREIAQHLTVEEMTRLWRQSVEEFISERTLTSQDGIMAWSVPEAEAMVAALRGQVDHMHPPAGLEGLSLRDEGRRMEQQRLELLMSVADSERVLAQIRSRVADYLSQVEQQIAFGQVNADVWERNRTYVDAELDRIAPDAVTRLRRVGAY
jgi:hypothetical protein